ncbi:MAG: hypothetical protein AB7F40_07535 [Victivallaceae bacterium]|nr:hypothetical protein [Victivallaceae bacterium]
MIPAEIPITVLRGGAPEPFSLDSLHIEVMQAFIRSDTPEQYLAEDVALAVESALRASDRPAGVFTESEINAAVIRILERTGLGEVASCFRKRHTCARILVAAQPERIAPLLSSHLAAVEGADFELLARKVAAAAVKIGAQEADPALFIELARFFQSSGAAAVELPETAGDGEEFIPVETLLKLAGSGLGELFEAKVLAAAPVSCRVFPSLRINFHLGRFARLRGLTPPVTEMMLAADLYKICVKLNAFKCAAENLYRETTGETAELPGNLFVPDMEEFAAGWLAWRFPEARESCMELFSGLTPEAFELRCD